MNALPNKVQLIGRLDKDSESFVFDDGMMKVNFPISYKRELGGMEKKLSAHNGMILSFGEVLQKSRISFLKSAQSLFLKGD